MSRAQFFLQLLKRSWQGGWRIAHSVEVILAIICGVLFYSHLLEENLKWILGIPFLILVLALLIGPYWHAYNLYSEAAKSGCPPQVDPEMVSECTRLKKEMASVRAACDQLFNLGKSSRGKYSVLSEEFVFHIEKNGDLRASNKVNFRAVNRVNMVRFDAEGVEPVPSISDIGLHATGDGNHRITMLPAQDSPTSKAVLLVFLPEVDPAAEASYEVHWKWPKLWKPLLDNGEDYWHCAVASESLALTRFTFKVAKEVGHLKLSNVGPGKAKQQLPVDPVDSEGYVQFIWEVSDTKLGETIAIKLEKG